MEYSLQGRTDYKGDSKHLFSRICIDYNLGRYLAHTVIPIGYEDFNVVLTTSQGKFFTKIFASFRDEAECKRYVNIMVKTWQKGISHPKVYKSNQGYLTQYRLGSATVRLCLMQFVAGKSFYQKQTIPTVKERQFLINQAVRINNLALKPPPVYDHWAITNFLQEYHEKRKYLSPQDNKLIAPLAKKFATFNFGGLPFCFVHGDITKTNVMKAKDGQLYILDFAVANYYPRIQELAVILCDLFFDPNHVNTFPKIYTQALTWYQKHLPLTKLEIASLPFYIKIAHVMHVLLATYEKRARKNISQENDHFLSIGRKGLIYTSKLWKN